VTLSWQSGAPATDGDIATYYVLYRFQANERSSPNDPRRILAVPRPAPGFPATFVDTTAVPGQAYAYYVTAVDRLHNESRPMRVVTLGQQAVELAAGLAPVGTAPQRPAGQPTIAAQPQAGQLPRPPARTPVTAESAPVLEPFTKVKIKQKTKKRRFLERLFGG
jgi:hypothetical protein